MHVVLRSVLCYRMLCYVMLRYDMLCYVTCTNSWLSRAQLGYAC